MCENPEEPGPPRWRPEGAVGEQVGWHITTRSVWELIREDGLLPCHSPELDKLNIGPIYCSWLWRDPPDARTRLCVALRIANRSGDTDLVELAVRWTAADVWSNRYGDRIDLKHDGVGAVRYPPGVRSVLIGRPIPPERVALASQWDLLALLTPAK